MKTINFRKVYQHFDKEIYRSGTIFDAQELAISEIKKEGIDTVIDFRSFDEVNGNNLDGLWDKYKIQIYHYPINDKGLLFKDINSPTYKDYALYYKNLLNIGADSYMKAFEVIAENKTKQLLISCSLGKDRTGLFIFLLLHILDVSESYIMHDFELTSQLLMEETNKFEAFCNRHHDYEKRIMVNKETLILLKNDLIEEYGSIINFIFSLGIDNEVIMKIKNKFIYSL